VLLTFSVIRIYIHCLEEGAEIVGSILILFAGAVSKSFIFEA